MTEFGLRDKKKFYCLTVTVSGSLASITGNRLMGTVIQMVVLPVLFLLGSLLLCTQVEAQSPNILILKQAALAWQGPLTCEQSDCNCTFTEQRGCCCAASDLFQIEDEVLQKLAYSWNGITTLKSRVQALTDGIKVAFKATMDPSIAIATPGTTERCFGPFNTNIAVPFSSVTLNTGNGYNPSLGIFTAPNPGVYVFSFTAYSSALETGRLYHKVQLMKNGKHGAAVWENNREDTEDSATQVVVLEMQRGDQVYLELMSGRKLCTNLQDSIFTGYMLYPYIAA
ncbi:cerebellin 18 [Archocentrus centrarchus]|uniref:cerebellin 18 n=1 Tax=Archocentrus centrarchus TaxID=63155 RepID=UPI0011EA03B7|nr:cerebellin-2-like [Archocentrus centrarchus]